MPDCADILKMAIQHLHAFPQACHQWTKLEQLSWLLGAPLENGCTTRFYRRDVMGPSHECTKGSSEVSTSAQRNDRLP